MPRATKLNGTAATPVVESSKPKGRGKAKSTSPEPLHTPASWRVAATLLARFTRDAGKDRAQVVPDELISHMRVLIDCYADSLVNPSAYREHTIGIGNGQSAGCRAVVFLRIGVPALQSDGAARKVIAGNRS